MELFSFRTSTRYRRRSIRETLLIMKFVAFFSLVLCMSASAKSYAQKVSLSEQNVSLEKIFSRIKKQTGYTFIYTRTVLQKAHPVSLSFTNAPVTTVMDSAFSGQPLTWTLFNNMIIIREKPEEAIPAAAIVQSREVTITGKVTDEKGEPLIGASVHEKGTQRNTISREDGSFSLEVSGPGITLVVSFIGYKTQEIVTGNTTSFSIRLQTANNELTDVVVVGYGTRKKVNLTGSLSVLDMKTMENRPVTNASQALHGVSGLWVNQAGGKPGQDVGTIRIRGVGTFNSSGNNPLVLVDGVEYNLNEINPDFIESITVLKDASAAIYGSRAANGVILVTTKTGKKAERSEVNYSFSYGSQQPTFLPDVVWDPIEYMTMKNQALINEGKSPAAVDYSAAQIEEYRNGMATNPYAYPNLNWFDRVMKNGYMQQHNLRISGGTDKVLYNIGLGYMDQDGILIDANHANRYSLNINVSAKVSERLKVGASLVGNYRVYSEPAFGGSGATKYYFNRLLRVLPIFTPYTADGKYGSTVFPTPGRNTIENPIMLLKEGKNDHMVQRNLIKVNADYRLPLDITYNATVGLDKLDGKAENFVPFIQSFHPITGVPNNYNVNPYSYNYNENELNLSLYHTLNWQRRVSGDHDVQVMLGSSYNSFRRSYFNARSEGYFDNTLTDLDAGSVNMSNGGRLTEDKLLSYFGRVNYSYRDKYLFEAVMRYDGSSRFAPGNRWGAFPSASAGWRIDQEPFLKDVKAVDLLKLRASWGKLGNQAVSLYSYSNTVMLGSDYPFNNVVTPGAAVTSYNDPGISWETTTTYNGGVDVSAWNGLLGASVDVFKRRTEGILRPVGIPHQVGGLAGPQRNVGVMDNTGYDLTLTHRNTLGDFSYEVSGSVSYVKNKVIDLKGETIISGRKIVKEGYALDSWYIYDAIGIYQTVEDVAASATVSNAVKPGYLQYRDVLKDGRIDGNDRVVMGSSIPAYNYSFNINLAYKNLRLETFWQGVQGINHYTSFNLSAPFNNGAGVTKEWVNESWTPDRRDARLPILTTATGAPEMFSAANASSFFLQSGSYLRMKNIQLKYEFAKPLLSRVNIQRLALFANAENLLTITNYRGFDPEKAIDSGAGADDIYEYPTLKTLSFGLNVTF